MTFTFVIATKDRAPLLRECLASFEGQELPRDDVEILVVDDASSDDTVLVARAAAATLPFPVRVVPNDGQMQNAGRNTGVRLAWGDVVVFIDDDELLAPEYGRVLAELVETHHDADGFGGPYVERPGPGLRTCRRCTLAGAAVGREADGTYARLLGGNMALRRELLDRVGPFDPELAGLGNETEWFFRARRAGARLHYDDRLWVWHRRDFMSLRQIVRKGYREGLRYHLYQERTGEPVAPHPVRLLRHGLHAVGLWCAKGAYLTARETGRSVGAWRRRRERR